VTHYRVVEELDLGCVALVSFRLETGRTHQVRIHLTEANCPLVGDPLYRKGNRKVCAALTAHVQPNRPMLHARVLKLTHPQSQAPMCFEAKPPPDFTLLLEAAGFSLP
jgi:23S rRNA pseudouridine1911/1915/1917 synthase